MKISRRDFLKLSSMCAIAPPPLIDMYNKPKYRIDIDILVKGIDYIPDAIVSEVRCEKNDLYDTIISCYIQANKATGLKRALAAKSAQYLYTKMEGEYHSAFGMFVDKGYDPLHAQIMWIMHDHIVDYIADEENYDCNLKESSLEYLDRAIEIIRNTVKNAEYGMNGNMFYRAHEDFMKRRFDMLLAICD